MKTSVLEISMTIVACCVAGLVLAGPQEDLLYDGKMNPACVWEVETGTNGTNNTVVNNTVGSLPMEAARLCNAVYGDLQ